ncbi:hypothetical protein BN1723_019731, partial [Verticillium longisporum]
VAGRSRGAPARRPRHAAAAGRPAKMGGRPYRGLWRRPALRPRAPAL